jgi:mRNA-degrading endonuclease toxin of MazEF toxin-antitoxin module
METIQVVIDEKLTRDNAIRYLSTVTVAPITSTIRGVPSEVVLEEEDGIRNSAR